MHAQTRLLVLLLLLMMMREHVSCIPRGWPKAVGALSPAVRWLAGVFRNLRTALV